MRYLKLDLTISEADYILNNFKILNEFIDADDAFFHFLNGVMLPDRVQRFAEAIKLGEHDLGLIRGIPYSHMTDGIKTPHFHNSRRLVNNSDAVHASLASQFGDIFGYSGQQSGKIINDIIPIEELSAIPNSSAGSKYEFELHTEDAFHSIRPEFLCLSSLRNKEKIGTKVSFLRMIDLNSEYMNILTKPVFFLKSNALHDSSENSPCSVISVINGSAHMRFNSYADTKKMDKDAYDAFAYMKRMLEQKSLVVPMVEGSFLTLNNSTVAHSRQAYSPAALGEGRWLLRCVTSNNLDKFPKERFTTAHIVKSL